MDYTYFRGLPHIKLSLAVLTQLEKNKIETVCFLVLSENPKNAV